MTKINLDLRPILKGRKNPRVVLNTPADAMFFYAYRATGEELPDDLMVEMPLGLLRMLEPSEK